MLPFVVLDQDGSRQLPTGLSSNGSLQPRVKKPDPLTSLTDDIRAMKNGSAQLPHLHPSRPSSKRSKTRFLPPQRPLSFESSKKHKPVTTRILPPQKSQRIISSFFNHSHSHGEQVARQDQGTNSQTSDKTSPAPTLSSTQTDMRSLPPAYQQPQSSFTNSKRLKGSISIEGRSFSQNHAKVTDERKHLESRRSISEEESDDPLTKIVTPSQFYRGDSPVSAASAQPSHHVNVANFVTHRGPSPPPKSNASTTSFSIDIPIRRPLKIKHHLEVTVPDHSYVSFDCEWTGCHAELMNMDTLRKHVYVVHGTKMGNGGRRCLWGKCGKAWEAKKNTTEERLMACWRKVFSSKKDWKTHIEEHHMISFSWHMGDGPKGSTLEKPVKVWHQPYLFGADGSQVSPSVSEQPLEEGKVKKNNARRFSLKRRGGLFGEDIIVPVACKEAYVQVQMQAPAPASASGEPSHLEDTGADDRNKDQDDPNDQMDFDTDGEDPLQLVASLSSPSRPLGNLRGVV